MGPLTPESPQWPTSSHTPTIVRMSLSEDKICKTKFVPEEKVIPLLMGCPDGTDVDFAFSYAENGCVSTLTYSLQTQQPATKP